MRLAGFVALRYLRPRRGRGVLSVVTAIAITGFAAGVGALILALAITNGFRDALQNELVGATAQLNLLKRTPTVIDDYPVLLEQMRKLPQVAAVAPEIYQTGLLIHGSRSHEVVVKGIIPQEELKIGHLLAHLQAGSLAPLEQHPRTLNLVLGKQLAASIGAEPGTWVDFYLPNA
ncbi:MAG: ABC transporter permease, partial [Terriglobales bacterium]